MHIVRSFIDRKNARHSFVPFFVFIFILVGLISPSNSKLLASYIHLFCEIEFLPSAKALACWPFRRENSDFSFSPHRYTLFFISRTLTAFFCVSICETTTSCFKYFHPAFSLSFTHRPSSCSGASTRNIPFKLIICKNYFLLDFFPSKCIIIWDSES